MASMSTSGKKKQMISSPSAGPNSEIEEPLVLRPFSRPSIPTFILYFRLRIVRKSTASSPHTLWTHRKAILGASATIYFMDGSVGQLNQACGTFLVGGLGSEGRER